MVALSETAFIYWLACRGMRHGNWAVRPGAAANIRELSYGTGPVAERAKKALNEATAVIAGSDAA